MVKLLERVFEQDKLKENLDKINTFLSEKKHPILTIYEQGFMEESKVMLRVSILLDDEATFEENEVPNIQREELIIKRDDKDSQKEKIQKFLNSNVDDILMLGNIGFIDRSKLRNKTGKVFYNKYVKYYLV